MAVMKIMAAIFAFLLLAVPALADEQMQAREIARLNNCDPKKISIYQQRPGADGNTIYQVDCTPAKTLDTTATSSATALLIGCDGDLCTLRQPVAEAGK